MAGYTGKEANKMEVIWPTPIANKAEILLKIGNIDDDYWLSSLGKKDKYKFKGRTCPGKYGKVKGCGAEHLTIFNDGRTSATKYIKACDVVGVRANELRWLSYVKKEDLKVMKCPGQKD